MTILNIYSLDDTENQNIIACLPEGKHIIGRGDLLKVTDKRVSRKHAVIEVSNGRVSLTSVHVNPCFFKAANGKTLTVLTQNQESLLNDGDQFALLPESYWFKVKIKNEDRTAGVTNGIDIPSEINGKRVHDNLLDTTENSDSKRARISSSHETGESSLNNSATTNNITTEIRTNYAGLNGTSPNSIEHIISFQENNEEHNTSLNLATTEISRDNSSKSDSVDKEIKEDPKKNNNPEPSTSINTSHNSPSKEIRNSLVLSPENVDKEIKEEPDNNSPEPGTSINTSQNSPGKEIKNDLVLSQEVKEEPLEDAGDNDQPVVKRETDDGENHTNNDNLPDSALLEPIIKMETNDDENVANNEASGSGTGTKKTRRERCWYAEKCFRKNPNHRESFSHPGDEDYNSDPDDDRPECSYGTTCYRKNIEHRREYKHTAKPAPKPRPRYTSPSPPGSPTAKDNSPEQKRKRKATPKKPIPQYDQETPEDDYDLEDPFINDGSSDDFQPSDYGIDSDSSDSEDTEAVEESQERKRMLKEAKKFTKKGKKK